MKKSFTSVIFLFFQIISEHLKNVAVNVETNNQAWLSNMNIGFLHISSTPRVNAGHFTDVHLVQGYIAGKPGSIAPNCSTELTDAVFSHRTLKMLQQQHSWGGSNNQSMLSHTGTLLVSAGFPKDGLTMTINWLHRRKII